MAGILDGEGSIHASKVSGHLVPRLAVGMKDRRIIKKIQKAFGGSFCMRASRHEKWSRLWIWQIYCRRVVELLKLVWPWLVVKRPQAMVVFRWGARGRRHRKPDEARRDDRILSELSVLNRRRV